MANYGPLVTVELHQLSVGTIGRAVKVLQQLLSLWGPGGSIPETGTFDDVTLGALLAYQQGHNLVADGICGPRTWESILGTLH